MEIKKYNIYKFYLSFSSIIYIWCLPFLSKIGFAEKNSTSISEFISNPQATGALAAVSFLPIILINEYQDNYINENSIILNKSLLFFEIMYGLFLSCPVTYASELIHELCVICFGLSFIIHSYFILYHIQFNIITKFLLCLGSFGFFLLLCLDSSNLIYWFVECISFSCMLLYTPIDWYLVLNKNNKYTDKPLLNI